MLVSGSVGILDGSSQLTWHLGTWVFINNHGELVYFCPRIGLWDPLLNGLSMVCK